MLAAASTLFAAGCGASTPKAVPFPTTTTEVVASAYSQSQVLGWVTPTLDNGASLVASLPASTPETQVLAGAQQLAVACGVSLKELGQTTWTKATHDDELRLAATITGIQQLVADPPAAGIGPPLHRDLDAMDAELAALHHDLDA